MGRIKWMEYLNWFPYIEVVATLLFHSNDIIFTAHDCVSHVNKQFAVIMECAGFSLLAYHWTLSRTSEVVFTSSVTCILTLSNQMLKWVGTLFSESVEFKSQLGWPGTFLSSREMVGIVAQIRPWLLPHLLHFIIRQSYCHSMQYCLSCWPHP